MPESRTRLGLALVVAAIAGGLLFAAHPPLGLAPSAYVVAPALVLALRLAGGGDPRDRAASPPRLRIAVALGVVAGALGYGAMISWLIAPAGMLGWSLLVLVQAAWLGLWSGLIARWIRSPLLPLVGAVAWVGMDTLRGLVPLSGFRWGALAESQIDGTWLLPIIRVLGASGATFLVVLVGLGLGGAGPLASLGWLAQALARLDSADREFQQHMVTRGQCELLVARNMIAEYLRINGVELPASKNSA